MKPADGKLGKKAIYSLYCGNENSHSRDGAFRRAASVSCPLDWASVRRGLCYGKWLMLFPLKLQRNNRQNALAVDPAKGKTGKKAILFTALWS